MGFMQNVISEKLAKKNTSKDLVDIYDAFMSEYGYIPLDDFLNFPQGLINVLIARINDRRKKKINK